MTRLASPSHAVYLEDDFTQALFEDLDHATSLVLLQSPYITQRRLNEIGPAIKRCINRGVRLCAFLRIPDHERAPAEIVEKIESAAAQLLSLGAHVTFKQLAHEKLAVIDGIVAWDGSLNSLSFNLYMSTERSTRWYCREKALEVMNTHNLHRCKTCSDLVTSRSWLEASIIDACIARRKAMGMSQRDLANETGLMQSLISEIESKKRDPQLSTILRMTEALRVGVRIAPYHLLPGIDETIAAKSVSSTKRFLSI